jgi:hypothetical protein
MFARYGPRVCRRRGSGCALWSVSVDGDGEEGVWYARLSGSVTNRCDNGKTHHWVRYLHLLWRDDFVLDYWQTIRRVRKAAWRLLGNR